MCIIKRQIVYRYKHHFTGEGDEIWPVDSQENR